MSKDESSPDKEFSCWELPIHVERRLQRERHAERLEKILNWLQRSSIGRKFDQSESFFIARGQFLEFQDGSVKEVISWLNSEGLHKRTHCGAFEVRQFTYENPWLDRLYFLKGIDFAPFTLSENNNDTTEEFLDIDYSLEDDIP